MEDISRIDCAKVNSQGDTHMGNIERRLVKAMGGSEAMIAAIVKALTSKAN